MALLDKLAQLATNDVSDEDFNPSDGVEIADRQKLLKRARAKYFTSGLTNILRRAVPDSPLREGYLNSHFCSSVLTQRGGKVCSTYCKNRWCMVCNRIRTATCINKYFGVLKDWGCEKYFVTLTVPNCADSELAAVIANMEKLFCRLRKRYGRRYERGGLLFQGLRKLEVTYNPVRDDYHPHYHFIIKGEEMAKNLVEDWLKGWEGTERKAQDCKPADDKSSKELFKYFTKIVSSQVKIKDGKRIVDRRIYPVQMDWILRVLKGKRTFQSFGFIPAQVVDNNKDVEEFTNEVDNEMFWIWNENFTDWVNTDSGELCTGYEPSEGMIKLFSPVDSG